MIIETKYSIGDVVFAPFTEGRSSGITCAACAGLGRVKLDGSPFTCGTCSGHGQTIGPTKYSAWVKTLTIGQVRVTIGGSEERQYMTEETGIGSGRLWPESDLFRTEADAQESAELKAKVSEHDAVTRWEKERAQRLARELAGVRESASA